MPNFDPDVLERNDRPIQRANMPELVLELHTPPRDHDRDVRFILDATALEELLALARQSPSQRVVIHGASIRSRTWRHAGHEWSTLTVLGKSAEPEPVAIVGLRR